MNKNTLPKPLKGLLCQVESSLRNIIASLVPSSDKGIYSLGLVERNKQEMEELLQCISSTLEKGVYNPDTIYVLYGGSSVDGAGPGEYQGFTLDKDIALMHFKETLKSPYNTGYVIILTQDKKQRPMYLEDWNNL